MWSIADLFAACVCGLPLEPGTATVSYIHGDCGCHSVEDVCWWINLMHREAFVWCWDRCDAVPIVVRCVRDNGVINL